MIRSLFWKSDLNLKEMIQCPEHLRRFHERGLEWELIKTIGSVNTVTIGTSTNGRAVGVALRNERKKKMFEKEIKKLKENLKGMGEYDTHRKYINVKLEDYEDAQKQVEEAKEKLKSIYPIAKDLHKQIDEVLK